MKYLLIAILFLSGCATIDCTNEEWKTCCYCNSNQPKCDRWMNRR